MRIVGTCLFLAAMLLGTAPIQAAEILKSGNQLLLDCKGNRESFCLGYIAAIADDIQYNKALSNFIQDESLLFMDHICLPQNLSTSQLEKVFVKWAGENPEQLHQPAAALVTLAFVDQWPCNKGI